MTPAATSSGTDGAPLQVGSGGPGAHTSGMDGAAGGGTPGGGAPMAPGAGGTPPPAGARSTAAAATAAATTGNAAAAAAARPGRKDDDERREDLDAEAAELLENETDDLEEHSHLTETAATGPIADAPAEDALAAPADVGVPPLNPTLAANAALNAPGLPGVIRVPYARG